MLIQIENDYIKQKTKIKYLRHFIIWRVKKFWYLSGRGKFQNGIRNVTFPFHTHKKSKGKKKYRVLFICSYNLKMIRETKKKCFKVFYNLKC